MLMKETRMKGAKRNKLESRGWRVGSAQELLGLSDEEAEYVELKLALSSSLRQWRTRRGVTQMELAKRLRSSQSRIAKMEAADTSVSIDLLVRSLLCVGATRGDLAKAIVKRKGSSVA